VIYTHLANTVASKREQLGEYGALLEKLEDVGYGETGKEETVAKLDNCVKLCSSICP
jgi:hypothetical protein